MDSESLATLLRVKTPEDRVITPSCPNEEELATFCEEGTAGDKLERILNHVADCGVCSARLALVNRTRGPNFSKRTPELAKAQAQRLVKQDRRKNVRRFIGWAAAAVVVLSLAMVVDSQRGLGPSPVPDIEPVQSQPNIRLRAPTVSPPQVLAPVSGAMVDSRYFLFRWTEIPGSLYYDIYIVSKMGDLVLKERVTETHWQAPSSLKVKPGAEYYVRVDAFLSDSKTISSEHVLFTEGEHR